MNYDDLIKSNPRLRSCESDVKAAWRVIEGWGLDNDSQFLEELKVWLGQWDDDIQLALKVLKNIDYYPSERIPDELDIRLDMLSRKSIHLSGDRCNSVVVLPENKSDSATLFPYFLARLEKPNLEVLSISEIKENPQKYKNKNLVFFNDTHGSGNQFINQHIWPHLKDEFSSNQIVVVGMVIAKDALDEFKEIGFVTIPDSPAANISDIFLRKRQA